MDLFDAAVVDAEEARLLAELQEGKWVSLGEVIRRTGCLGHDLALYEDDGSIEEPTKINGGLYYRAASMPWILHLIGNAVKRRRGQW